MLRVLLFATFITGLAAKTCPWSMGKFPFDNEKFAGDWFVVATTAFPHTEPPKCARFHVTSTPTTRKSNYKAVINGEKISLNVWEENLFKHAPETAGVSLSEVLIKGVPGIGPFTSIVVATDYDTYAVHLSCNTFFYEKNETFIRDVEGAIAARDKSLSKETLDVLKNILSSYNIDPSKIYDVDQTSCGN